MRLADGEVYISRLELNRENGIVQKPLTPVLRFSTPVFDSQGKAAGVVVLNIYAEHFLKKLAIGSESQLRLIDNQGYYLYHSTEPEKTFGFDLGHEFRSGASIVKNYNTVINHNQITFFQKINIYHDPNKYWVLISTLDDVFAPVEKLLWAIFIIAIFSAIAAVTLSLWMTKRITTPINQAITLAEKIAKGYFEVKSPLSSSIETERLLNALQKMAERLGKMVGDIQASEATTKAIVETAVDMIITISSNGIIKSANPAVERVFGYSLAEILGSNVSMLMPEEVGKKHDDFLAHYMQKNKTSVVDIGQAVMSGQEIIGRKKNGTLVPLRLSVSSIEEGGNATFCGILHDLTKEKSIQSQLRQSDKLAGIGTLATGMAHELRQPLTVMSLTAENTLSLIEENDFSLEEVPAVLNQVVNNCKRMNHIVDHLRSFARESESKVMVAVDIESVVKRSFTLLDAQFRNNSVSVSQNIAENLSKVNGNSNQLEQVMINLLTNARDALENTDSPAVKIMAKQEEQLIVVTISDNGPGIPKSIQSTIFDPFFTTKEIGKGTGLGLSISHGIIADHRGTITVGDAEDGGAEFRITLPIVSI